MFGLTECRRVTHPPAGDPATPKPTELANGSGKEKTKKAKEDKAKTKKAATSGGKKKEGKKQKPKKDKKKPVE